MKRIIVNADDFGLAIPVNAAVERAHREGIVTTASLMVAEPAAADAIARAKALGTLRVGLHVVLVHGRPAAPPESIPGLLEADGMFSKDLAATGVRYFFRPGIRRQIETEVRAQFARFAASGLPLDHVNAQCHFHLHPTVLGIILRVARDYGKPPVRVPYEPFGPSWRTQRDRFGLRFANGVLLAPWVALMRARLRLAGVGSNDRVFGLSDVGHMTAERLVRYAAELPDGTTEVFFHVATGAWDGMADDLRGYELAGELAAVTDPAVAAAFAARGAQRVSYESVRRAS
jgi:hopanoid biosynthesis associated protein HpnK